MSSVVVIDHGYHLGTKDDDDMLVVEKESVNCIHKKCMSVPHLITKTMELLCIG